MEDLIKIDMITTKMRVCTLKCKHNVSLCSCSYGSLRDNILYSTEQSAKRIFKKATRIHMDAKVKRTKSNPDRMKPV